MARKQVTHAAPIPPPVVKSSPGRVISLYLYEEDIEAIDEITAKMGGSRSDAVRWLISLTGFGRQKFPRKSKVST